MRIMIFTQFFPPEIGATQTRLETFAAGLAERGHDVEVICEVPNHPQGVVREGFRRRPVVRRSADGYKVIHVWVHATPNKTTRTRLAFYGVLHGDGDARRAPRGHARTSSSPHRRRCRSQRRPPPSPRGTACHG